MRKSNRSEENTYYDFVTFSVPDYLTIFQKRELKLIAKAIGMKNVNIINESSAIMMYYGYTKYRDMFVYEKNKVYNTVEKYVVVVDVWCSKTTFIFAKFTY